MNPGDLPFLDLTSGDADCSLLNTLTGEPCRYVTAVKASYRSEILTLEYRCADPSIWSTLTQRDDPLYEEEVVEVFLSPGIEAPARYFEFEVSPAGVLWDGWVDCPNLSRDGMASHPEWNCSGLEWGAERNDAEGWWAAWMKIPLRELCQGEPPAEWRANFYRIERPKNSEPEYQAWSPTLKTPADFHVPERFGRLRLR